MYVIVIIIIPPPAVIRRRRKIIVRSLSSSGGQGWSLTSASTYINMNTNTNKDTNMNTNTNTGDRAGGWPLALWLWLWWLRCNSNTLSIISTWQGTTSYHWAPERSSYPPSDFSALQLVLCSSVPSLSRRWDIVEIFNLVIYESSQRIGVTIMKIDSPSVEIVNLVIYIFAKHCGNDPGNENKWLLKFANVSFVGFMFEFAEVELVSKLPN